APPTPVVAREAPPRCDAERSAIRPSSFGRSLNCEVGGDSGSRTARSTTAGPNILFARHYSFIVIVEGCFDRKILLNRFFFQKLTGLKPPEPDVSILQRGGCEPTAH